MAAGRCPCMRSDRRPGGLRPLQGKNLADAAQISIGAQAQMGLFSVLFPLLTAC